MLSPNKFQIFNPNDDQTFVYGVKVLNKMKSGNESTPYRYDYAGNIVDDTTLIKYPVMEMSIKIDDYQKDVYQGSFFGKWAHDDNPVYEKEDEDDEEKGYAYAHSTYHENAYIFAFLIGDKEIIGKYKCVYGSNADNGMTWYDILKNITKKDIDKGGPYPNFQEYGNDGQNELSKICPDYKPIPNKPVKPVPVKPTPVIKTTSSSLSTAQKVYIGLAVLVFIAGLALLIKLAIS
jgi:hypothetical protein